MCLTCCRPSGPDPHMLGDLCDQAEPVQCCLINRPHLVEHKRAGQQHSKRQQLHGILGTLRDKTVHTYAEDTAGHGVQMYCKV